MAHTSILILTHHKAASTLLRRIILSSPDLRYKAVDYAGSFWKSTSEQMKWNSVHEKLNENPARYFKSTGHIYGPIRDTIDVDAMKFRRVIVARNPVSTLESEYVSFGFTHPEPKQGGKVYDGFMERRRQMQSQTVDEYAIAAAPRLLARFKELHSVSEGALILSYEKLIKNREAAIRMYHEFAGIRLPVALTMGIISLRERKPGVSVHRSRDSKFGSFKLTPAVRSQIEESFESVSGIYRRGDQPS